MKFSDLTFTQQKVLRYIAREPNRGEVQIAGKNRAPFLSAARALINKGLAWTYTTGSYGATDKGRSLLDGKEAK